MCYVLLGLSFVSPGHDSTPTTAFRLAYTPKHPRRAVRCAALPQHPHALLALQVRLRPNELRHGRMDLGGACFPASRRAPRQPPCTQRVAASRKTLPRCKVSVITEATAQTQTAVRPSALQPYAEHFHPRPASMQLSKPESRRIGHPLAAINTVPYPEQVRVCIYLPCRCVAERLQVIAPNLLDAWDFCLRKLFVLKSTPLKKAITYVSWSYTGATC